MNNRKRLQKALQSPANLRFGEMVTLVEGFGFRLSRVTGGHHIYAHPGIPKLMNQEVDGKAKPYQVRQFLKIVEQYNLKLRDNS
jgi:predicted RNA binding protein YcfA (HicA-like mRNA interferase family)